jgi:hypothetical protein
MRVWDFKNEVSKKAKKREFKSAMIRFQTLIGNDTEFLTLPLTLYMAALAAPSSISDVFTMRIFI